MDAHRSSSVLGVTVENDIPENHPHRQALEDAILAALRPVTGSWKVRIVCSKVDAWWVLTIRGPAFDWAVMLWSPREQTPDFIFDGLHEALRTAGLINEESLMRHLRSSR